MPLPSRLALLAPGLGNPVNNDGQDDYSQTGFDSAAGLVFGQADDRFLV